MKQRTNRIFSRIAIGLLVALFLAIAAIGIRFGWEEYKSHRADSLRDADNGMSRIEVDREFGKPVREFPGFYSNEFDRAAHPEPFTCVYRMTGGEFFVAFEAKDGAMNAFASDFLPQGAAF